MRMIRSSTRHFTLVELLAVLAIMLVVFAMSGVALSKMFTGTNVESASRMVGAQLRLARQYAITHRTRVAVLLPGDQGGADNADKRFSAVRACEVEWNTLTSQDQFLSWIENTKWEYLPRGAVVYEIDDTSGLTSNLNGSINDDCTNLTGVPDFGGSACRAIVFRPTGRPVFSTFLRQYIHIIDGTYAIEADGTKPIVRNKDNWVEIEVEQYTGRLEFSLPED